MLFEEWFRLISVFTDGTGRPKSTQELLDLPYIAHNSYGLVTDTFIYYPVVSYSYCLILKIISPK